jgi:hypothetical protein
MSARGMPFSFSIYSRTDRISLLMVCFEFGKKKADPKAHFFESELVTGGSK